MKLVAGLGNPGLKYLNTPHNVGFEVIDALAADSGCQFRSARRHRAETAEAMVGGERVILAKPQTYMNESGMAIGSLLHFFKLGPADLVVVMDDADLELGRLRIRPRGGTGGHRGLASVQNHVGSDAFPRVRLGIGRTDSEESLVGHVLRAFPKDVRPTVDRMIGRAQEAVVCLLDSGVESAMNRYNSPPEACEE